MLADVASSALAKGAEAGALRAQTLGDERAALEAAAHALRGCFDAGGKLLALGNGGSATDAMDAVADLRHPPAGLPPRPAIDLTEDAADPHRGRQRHRRRGDVRAPGHRLRPRRRRAAVVLDERRLARTCIAALAEARRRGLVTIALVGYDGGRIAAERLADHVVVTRSEHIPRIQEAQASAWHVLRELVEDAA